MREGACADSTSCRRARVIATYSALSSSRWRSALSCASASSWQAGGRVSLARNEKRHGAGASPGHSTITPMLSGFCGPASVSSSSTVSASSPLAPCTVSRFTASTSCTAGAAMPPAFIARTKAYGVG